MTYLVTAVSCRIIKELVSKREKKNLGDNPLTAGARSASGEAQVSSLVSQLDDTNSRLDSTAARLSTLESAIKSTAADARQQLQEQQQAVAAATALAAAAAERSEAAEVAAASAATTAAAAGGGCGDGSVSGRSRGGGRVSSNTAQQALITESLTKQLAELKLQFGELSATVTNMSRASRVAAAFQHRRSSKADDQSVKSEDLGGAQSGAAAVAAGGLCCCAAMLLLLVSARCTGCTWLLVSRPCCTSGFWLLCACVLLGPRTPDLVLVLISSRTGCA
jgi:uncharacterized phage infection (PIP) family protein YhgE